MKRVSPACRAYSRMVDSTYTRISTELCEGGSKLPKTDYGICFLASVTGGSRTTWMASEIDFLNSSPRSFLLSLSVSRILHFYTTIFPHWTRFERVGVKFVVRMDSSAFLVRLSRSSINLLRQRAKTVQKAEFPQNSFTKEYSVMCTTRELPNSRTSIDFTGQTK